MLDGLYKKEVIKALNQIQKEYEKADKNEVTLAFKYKLNATVVGKIATGLKLVNTMENSAYPIVENHPIYKLLKKDGRNFMVLVKYKDDDCIFQFLASSLVPE